MGKHPGLYSIHPLFFMSNQGCITHFQDMQFTHLTAQVDFLEIYTRRISKSGLMLQAT